MRSRGLSTTSEQTPLVNVEIVESDHDPYVRAAGDKLLRDPARVQKYIRNLAATYEERYQIFLFIGLLFALIDFLIGDKKTGEKKWRGRFAVETS